MFRVTPLSVCQQVCLRDCRTKLYEMAAVAFSHLLVYMTASSPGLRFSTGKHHGECTDTALWDNNSGKGCIEYAAFCSGGAVRTGAEWSLGPRFNSPERHCCVCGKGRASARPSLHAGRTSIEQLRHHTVSDGSSQPKAAAASPAQGPAPARLTPPPTLDTSALNTHFHIAAANANQPSLLIRQAAQLFDQMQELQTLSGHTHTIPPFAENSQWPFVEHEPLQRLLVKYGSDKHDAWHAYTGIYSTVLSSLRPRSNILEVGMGTNNTKLVSAMHSSHRPGASLRAWRDFMPEARIFGADVDRDISGDSVLFRERSGRISTAWADQLDLKSLRALPGQFRVAGFDLIIDDGLHAVGSGFNMILLALHTLNRGGWLVIEDIPPSQLQWFTLIDRILHDTLGANVSTSIAMPGKCCHVYILRRTS